MSRQSLLWSLNFEGKPVSYLFGTMHVRDDRAYRLCQQLYPLINNCDCYVGEMDLHPRPNVTMPAYDILKYITDKKYDKIHKQFLRSFHIDLHRFKHLHPLLIMSVLSTQDLSIDHIVSLDEHLWLYSEENGKEMSGLESYERQFEILHTIDPAAVYKQLVKLARNPGSIRKQTERGINHYINGRIHELYMFSKSSMHELRKKIIYERNRNMVEFIKNMDESKSYFITVGAGHLSGKFGILPLLKREGVRVKAIKLEAVN